MKELTLVKTNIDVMSKETINKAYELETYLQEFGVLVDIKTTHTLHSGVYTRTVFIPAGVVMVGAYIKIPTTLIVSGHCALFIGEESVEMSGYNVITASADRKQAVLAIEDINVTMIFKTLAKTVEDAESEFTNEVDKLLSRKKDAINDITIVKEQPCLAVL